MGFKIDPAISANENLFKLVCHDNAISLNIDEYQFTDITPVEGSPNTMVVMSALPSSRYSGDVTLSYNRMSLDANIYAGPPFLFGPLATAEEIFTLFTEAYKVIPGEVAMVGDMPDLKSLTQGEKVSFTFGLKNAESLVYLSEPVTIECTFLKPLLNTTVSEVDMNGFETAAMGNVLPVTLPFTL